MKYVGGGAEIYRDQVIKANCDRKFPRRGDMSLSTDFKNIGNKIIKDKMR